MRTIVATCVVTLALLPACSGDDGGDGGGEGDATGETGDGDGGDGETGDGGDGDGATTDGGDGDTTGGPTTGDTASTGDTGGGPGQITVMATDIAASTGRVMLAFVSDETGNLGAVCEMITEDPASITSVVKEMTDPMSNPCELGDPVVFDEGTYTVSAGTYVPGEQTPGMCSMVDVMVAGDTDAVLPAFGGC